VLGNKTGRPKVGKRIQNTSRGVRKEGSREGENTSKSLKVGKSGRKYK